MAENEKNLQTVLDYVNNWCKKWRLVVNNSKSKIMHFITVRKPKSSFKFHMGNKKIEYISDYKYLSLILNEYLKYNASVEVLSKSAGSALGSLKGKFRAKKDMGYGTY